MATNVTAGSIGWRGTLVANEITTVTFADDLVSVEIMSDGGAEMIYTIDGSTPSLADKGGSYAMPAGLASVAERQPHTSGQTVVKMLSAGTPTVYVHRGD